MRENRGNAMMVYYSSHSIAPKCGFRKQGQMQYDNCKFKLHTTIFLQQ